MTKQPHDQFAKQYLKGLLAPLGTVESSRDVMTEVQQVDVWFEPSSQSTTAPQMLGVLGRLVTVSCLLEAFRHQPIAIIILVRYRVFSFFLTLNS